MRITSPGMPTEEARIRRRTGTGQSTPSTNAARNAKTPNVAIRTSSTDKDICMPPSWCLTLRKRIGPLMRKCKCFSLCGAP